MIATINRAIAKKREDGEKGFTLIELLVVILIIGVLAAIAIPVFLSQRENAWRAQVESDIANAAIAAESFSVGDNGSYLNLDLTALEDNGYNATDAVNLDVGAHDASHFTLIVTHDQLDGTWTYDSTTGLTAFAP